MAGLKELKTRISSVKSTQKITSAMKMVAASRLRRAQGAAEAARPYADRMQRMIASILAGTGVGEGAPALLAGSGAEDTHLLVPVTSDRGLCGGFNASIIRETRRRIERLEDEGKTVKLLSVGRKARDILRRDHGDKIIETFTGIGRSVVQLEEAQTVAARVRAFLDEGEFDVCTVIFNRFVSAMTQVVTPQQVIPVAIADTPEGGEDASQGAGGGAPEASYEYEPSQTDILDSLLPANLDTQIFRALLESSASEHGARMTAMDNATRNAGEMIDNLTMTFNRTRQAQITSELIEIISGAEALK
ncbi:MAG: F0F1 ATP synthase subunit gamma [Rhodospirillales bacterium]|jgi:F-type H+-transporting ATPase subunit gamma|nr:F0F1 ATP synthase subunit gamma [Rhodospirillaceae bacterium]MDP6428804.1 F0F1 ATP synthase subunit gamma [Rhodospirillales bacterium]MDP6643235.1 F0F1 ATP synthase subunit gamma [Rhodospirillales bacterium]MDP6840911.1 F0F1 ATP synthase subunit gamma [Rhodospirillales bacterium]|tara:strand:- start:4408 stop:5319 length:912 start_codon:yes stop_codon:yes gene_type:complete